MRFIRRLFGSVIVLGAIATPLLYGHFASADLTSLWAESQQPSFQEISRTQEQTPRTYYGARCEPATAPVKYYPQFPDIGLPRDVDSAVCLSDSIYGKVDADKRLLVPPGATRAGALSVSSSPESAFFLPTPHTEKAFALSGTRLLGYDRARDFLARTAGPVGGYEYVYFPKFGASRSLRHNSGEVLQLRTIATSGNGHWAVAVEQQSHLLLKINLDTFEVLAVGTHFPLGLSSPFMSISDDGRYIATTSDQAGQTVNLRVIDTGTCRIIDPFNNLALATGCGQNDLTSFVKSRIGNFEQIFAPEFSSDGTNLSLSVVKAGVVSNVTLTASGHSYSGLDYLALGDSFSSGEGDLEGELYYKAGTDVRQSELLPEGEKCHVSTRSYPYLLAAQAGISSSRFESVACSGALVDDVLNLGDGYLGQEDRLEKFNTPELLPVLSEFRQDAIESNIPGRVGQLRFVEKYKPKALTISIGGNDVGFVDILKSCLQPFICSYASDPAERARKASEVLQLTKKLETTYRRLHEASPLTKIYVVGYPQITNTAPDCDFNVHLDMVERQFVVEGVRLLNRVVATAAARAGVAFIDIEDALGDSVLCGSDKPLGVNGLKAGDDIGNDFGLKFKLFGNESYHPNQFGHERMATAVSNEIALLARSGDGSLLGYQHCTLSGAVVCPVLAGDPERPSYFDGTNQNVKYDPFLLGDDVVQAGGSIPLRLTNLLPSSSVSVTLHSVPTQLGTFAAGIDGKLDATLQVPVTAVAGYHTIRASATLVSGEAIEVYGAVYVYSSPSDIDGNGKPDAEQKCLIVEDSRIDQDGDNTDDACDPFIGAAPSTPEVSEPSDIQATVSSLANVQPTNNEPLAGSALVNDSGPVTRGSLSAPSLASGLSVQPNNGRLPAAGEQIIILNKSSTAEVANQANKNALGLVVSIAAGIVVVLSVSYIVKRMISFKSTSEYISGYKIKV